MIVKWNNNIVDFKCKVFIFFLFFIFSLQIHPFFLCWFMSKKKKKKRKENMQHMISGTHTINRSHQPVLIVTPPLSAPSHRTGLEPGIPAREAGRSKRNAKGYSSSCQTLQSVAVLDCIKRLLMDREGHIAFRLKTGSALIAVWKRTASCSTF